MGIFGMLVHVYCDLNFKVFYSTGFFILTVLFWFVSSPLCGLLLQWSKLLKDQSKRKQYDEDGIIPYDNDETNEESKESWKEYFDLIFGKVSTDDIDSFARKYKMSDEEEKDVLENYVKFKGWVAMLFIRIIGISSVASACWTLRHRVKYL